MISNKIFLLTFICFLFTFCIHGQQTYETEVMDDSYLPMPAHERKTSKAYEKSTYSISIRQVNIDENGNDILNDAANEPSLAIDPTNPSRMVIGWRQFDNIKSNFRQAGIAYTEDAGKTWTNLPPIEQGLFRSDPVLSTNSEGVFFYNSLADNYSCDVFKTTDLENWEDKVYAFGGDKQWMVIDNTEQSSQGNIYAFWKAAWSDCDGGNFTRSMDEGETYEACSLLEADPTRGTLAIGPDGELYACGGLNGSHYVMKSTSAKNPNEIVEWELETFVDLKGRQALYAGPNPSGMLGQVWIATDNSILESRGNVYLLSSTVRNDNGDPADIMFSRSEDGGATWTEAFKINDDESTDNWQWFGTMSVAPNGRIDVVWLDTRDDLDGINSALYYAYSYDAGSTWSINEKLSDNFDSLLGWPNQQKMGDYFHMISFDEGAHLAWCGTFTGGQDIFYSFIPAVPPTTSISAIKKANILKMQVYPNPISDDSFVLINSKINQPVDLSITDIQGKQSYNSIQVNLQAGENKISFEQFDLSPQTKGLYIITLKDKKGNEVSSKMVVQ